MRPAVIISPQSPRFFHLIIGFLQMLKHLISISALVVVASGACFDNGDKEIGGACYKFVAQKLSFNDARDWCHYKNPVTASYLAHVPNQFTANFLASYARSAFGQNDGYFWIGLSRTKNWTPWTWDTGYAAAFTNFNSDQLTQNWAAESVVNTKWSTFGEEEKMNFVCSYDPTEPPTFAPPTSAGPTTTPRPTSRPITTQSVPTTTEYDGECVPGQNTTLLFAYSNDFDPDVVLDSGDLFSFFDENVVGKFTSFANVLFDTKQGITFKYSETQKDWADSIKENLPIPEYRYPENNTGSDVTAMLRIFLKQRPICGATILLALKRNSQDTEMADILQLLRMHHVMIYTVASDQPIGGYNFDSMYNLVSKSNGIFIFNSDDRQGASIFNTFGHLMGFELAYSTTSVVHGQGSLNLPPIIWSGFSMMVITVQAHALTKNFKEAVFTFQKIFDIADKQQEDLTYEYLVNEDLGNACDAFGILFYGRGYNITLEYSYQNELREVVEARIFAPNVTTWPPYNN